MLNPKRKVTATIPTLKTTEMTPMIDIFCSSAIYFLRMRRRLTLIAETTVMMRAISPE